MVRIGGEMERLVAGDSCPRVVDLLRGRVGRGAEGCVVGDAVAVSVGGDHSRGLSPPRDLLTVAGFSPEIAALFAVVFGAANGVVTIARGALPLALFGAAGYGRVVGRIARPAQICQALAPFALASAIDRFSDRAALEILIAAALFALCCFMAIRRPA